MNLIKLITRSLSVIILLAGSTFGLLIGFIGTAHAATNDDWPTSLHDLQRTGGSADTNISTSNALQLAKAWSYKTGGVIPATATVTGGIVYVGSWDGYEYALNATTGALVWKTYLGVTNYNPICIPPTLGVSSPPTVQNGVVYLGGGDSYWYALNANTGAVLWKLYIGDSSAAGGNYNWAGPLIYNGYAYIGVASLGDCPLVQGKLLKVNLATHNIENTLPIVPNGQTGGGIWTSPALDTATGTIYTATGTKNTPTQHMAQAFVAIDTGNMEIKDHWELPNADAVLDSDFGTSTTLFTDTQGRKLVSAINKNGKAYAFQRTSLSAGPVWSQYVAEGGFCPTCGDSTVSSGAYGGGFLYQAGGNGLINGQGYKGTVRALNPATGQTTWQHQSSGPVIGALAYANGLVFAGAGSVLEVLNATTGQTLYSYDTGAQIYGGPSIANGYVYVGSTTGTMYGFNIGNIVAPPADPNCPAGWTCQDVGNVGAAGSETYANGNWTISASGGGLSGPADSFRLATQPSTVDGNVQIIGKITAQQNGDGNAQAGLILRQSNDPGAPFYAVMVKPGNNLVVQYRKTIGGNAIAAASSTTLGSLPKYLMIQKNGNILQGATSTDGTSYTLVPGSNTKMVLPSSSIAGLAVASGGNVAPTTAALGNITIASPSIVPAAATDGSACPTGWSCQDVGNPALTGGQTLTNGTWTINASGGDIWGNSDQFHYVSQNIAADGTVSARVTATPTTDPWAKTGVMIRGSNADDAAYYAALLIPDKSIHIQYRYGNGFGAQEITKTTGNLPQYLRVTRSGTTVTTYTSSDGTNWTPLPGSTLNITAMAGSAFAGLAVTSHNGGSIGTATLDNVAVTASAPAPPNICPNGWTCQDIGAPTPTGDQVFSNGSWSITAGGGDIWGNYDTFHFVSEALTGDATVSTRVASQSNTGAWAKAGPMLRASSDPQAPYYAAFITPGSGIVVQWRNVQGGQTNQATTTGTAPVYLKITRTAGGSLTAYSSPNGTTWTAIAGSSQTIPTLAATALGGLAATSHDTFVAGTIVFDNVTATGNGGTSGLPTPWQAAAIGNPTPAGSVSYNNFAFTVKGGGNDMWGTTDQSEYAYQSVGTDGELVARITSQTNTDPWAKAGIMFKISTASGSNYAAVMTTPSNGIHFQWNLNSDNAGIPVTTPYVWLKMKRDGSLFSAFQSADGINWYKIGQTTINMPATVTGGMFVNAHNGGTSLGTATFDNVSFAPTGGSPLPAPWQAFDIGQTGLPGSSSYSPADGTFTVKGAGSDIWGNEDHLQFMYQTLTNTGTITAKLNSLDITDPWAKAGVMVKASTTAGSNYALLAATPGNGLHMQYNFTGDTFAGNYSFPNAWLRLTRNGNTVTTFSSSDGTTWTQVGTTTVTLPTNALMGLFVNAHDGGQALSTAQFTNVTITP